MLSSLRAEIEIKKPNCLEYSQKSIIFVAELLLMPKIMNVATRTIQLTIPASDYKKAERISNQMGWIISIPQPDKEEAESDKEALAFLRSLQLTPATPIPADEDTFDAIIEEKYLR